MEGVRQDVGNFVNELIFATSFSNSLTIFLISYY